MHEVPLISSKTKRQVLRYCFLVLLAVITWISQFSIFSTINYFDAMPNIMFLGCLFFGITCGPFIGGLFGLIISFFVVSVSYDHIFYFSYPLTGLIAGLFSKNTFSDELIFFLLLVLTLIIPVEALNGFQYQMDTNELFYTRLKEISLYSMVLNLLIAPIFYFLANSLAKSLKIRL